MPCPTKETLLHVATETAGGTERISVLDHIEACSDCRVVLEDFQKVSRSLSSAHRLFEEGHEAARVQLLNALPSSRLPTDRSISASRFTQILSRIGGTPMRRRVTFGSVSLLLVAISAFAFFWSPEQASAWDDVVKAFESKPWIHGEMKLPDGTIVSDFRKFLNYPNKNDWQSMRFIWKNKMPNRRGSF